MINKILIALCFQFWSINTFAQIPYPPTPMFPNNTSHVSIIPQITWSDGGPYANTYMIQCGNWGITSNAPGSAIIPYSYHLEPSTSYTIHGITRNNSTGQTAHGFAYFSTGPVASLYTPSNGENEIKLDAWFDWWNAATPVAFQISKDIEFSSIVYNNDTGNFPVYFSIPEGILNDSSIYYWRVINDGLPSLHLSFTTITHPPGQPLISYPIGIMQLPGLIECDYNAILSSTSKFWLQLSEAENFNTIIYNDSTKKPENMPPPTLFLDYNLPDGVLDYNATYYLRICAGNQLGWGDFAYKSFETKAPSPNLYLPENNATNVGLTPTLDWGDIPHTTRYRIEINRYTEDREIVLLDSTLDTSQYSVPTNVLQRNSDYYWKITPGNQHGWGYPSVEYRFTTLPELPSPPDLLYPANLQIDLPLHFILDWSDVTNAGKYNIQLSDDSVFISSNIVDSILAPSQFDINTDILTLGRVYFWKVRAYNDGGWGNFSSISRFTTLPNIPNIPILISPQNGSTDQPTNITLKWGRSSDSKYRKNGNMQSIFQNLITNEKKNNYAVDNKLFMKYRLDVSADSSFSSGVFSDSTITDTAKYIIGLSNNTKYFWRVKAGNQSGWGEYCMVWNFTTGPPVPSTPTLLSPANGSVDVSLNPVLDWFDLAFAESYRIQVSLDSLFANSNFDTVVSISNCAIPAGRLNTMSKYYWRVNASNISGSGNWSEVWQFVTLPNVPFAPVLVYPERWSTGNNTNITFIWRKSAESFNIIKKNKIVRDLPKNKHDENNSNKTVIEKNKVKDLVELQSVNRYWFECSTDSAFIGGVIKDTLVTDTVKTLSGLNVFTNYYWRVKSMNQTGWGTFSDIWGFKTLQMLPLNLKVNLEGFWNGIIHIPDTIRVYLSTDIKPYVLADSQTSTINGSGLSNLVFSRAPNGMYYIIVKHRNHIETWSGLPQSFTAGIPLNYDFTSDSTKAYGCNMKKIAGNWVFITGDANQDGSIDAIDVMEYFIPQFGHTGYLNSDFNGDNSVDASDIPYIISNYGIVKIVPNEALSDPNINKRNSKDDNQKRKKKDLLHIYGK